MTGYHPVAGSVEGMAGIRKASAAIDGAQQIKSVQVMIKT
jgi:hypothetical protein